MLGISFQKNRNKPENRKKIITFTLCLIFSFVAWLFIKLSRETVTIFPMEVHVKEIPEEVLFVNQTDSAFALTVETTGIKILSSGFSRSASKMEPEFFSLQRIVRDNETLYYITGTQAKADFSLRNDIPRSDLSIQPDTIFFTASEAFRKKVPIVLEKDIQYYPGFKLYDIPALDPDSVYVTGPELLKDSVQQIHTHTLHKTRVDNDIHTSVKLFNPLKNRQVKLSDEATSVYINVEEFTEATAELPLVINCPQINEDNKQNTIMLFPDKASIYYLVALKDVRAVSPHMFKAGVNCPDTIDHSRNRIETQVLEYPGIVDIIRISPSEVEYIWVEQ